MLEINADHIKMYGSQHRYPASNQQQTHIEKYINNLNDKTSCVKMQAGRLVQQTS